MGMKPSIQQVLVARLAPYKGMHCQIAREAGISQSSISRVSRGDCSPTLDVAQRIFNWLDQNESRAVRIMRHSYPDAAPVGQQAEKQCADGGELCNLEPAPAVHG
jgi:predicted transcriptional regulator